MNLPSFAQEDYDNLRDDAGFLSDLASAMALAGAAVGIQPIAQACRSLIKELRRFHPVMSAATFGALLTQKRLQSNCLRLEVLVHLCVACGGGRRAATPQLLTQGFAAVGNACGYLEDPPEDIFVGNISSSRGNYRALEGIWESSTFYLQRFVSMVDELPAEGQFQRIANSVHALLKVSDLVCERAALHRNDLGELNTARTLPSKIAQRSSELRNLMRFSLEDLRQAGIDINDLQPFIFDPSIRSRLLEQSISHTDLERYPIGELDGQLFLLLPTAITVAVRRFLIEILGTRENREIFVHHLAREYSRLFNETPLLGERGSRVPFVSRQWGTIGCMAKEIDEGRYLNLVFFLDTVENMDAGGFSGMFLGGPELEKELMRAIQSMEDHALKQKNFRDGITLIVGCGVGRGAALGLPLKLRERWDTEFISAPDLCTLSWSKEMKPLHLWRLIQMRTRLEQMGVWLQNMNGLLNLVAWANSLEGHLIPHADLPTEVIGRPLHLSIVQNSLVQLRHEVATNFDCHAEQFIDGCWRMVRTIGQSAFGEDKRQPVYGSIEPREGAKPIGACITKQRTWWFEIASPDGGPDTGSYERWKMLETWTSRAAIHLEHAFSSGLGQGPVLWRCIFTEPQENDALASPSTAQEAAGAIQTEVDTANRTVELRIGPEFDRALFNVDNIAEAALVTALVRGVSQLAQIEPDNLDKVVSQIVPNAMARQSHAFVASKFRDFIPGLSRREPVTISCYDDAATKLGLGWLVRTPEQGHIVEGKNQCLQFLNDLVRYLEDELCKDLAAFNRTHMLTKLLVNHEVASASRERWHRTSSAILALRDDKAAALAVMRDHEFKLNAVFQTARILIEMAICECPVEGGLLPGDLDLSRLMTIASQLYHLGGWSDLVRWDCMEPRLVIRPLGDVHANHDFIETVMDGFGSATSEYRYLASARDYGKNLQVPDITPEAQDQVEIQFLQAWYGEFGTDFDTYRRFVDAVENWGIEVGEPVIQISRANLEELAGDTEIGRRIVSNLCFTPRPSWRLVPEGYDDKDIAPWRFRRRLSVTRLPLLQIHDDPDSPILVAPGMLRESFAYIVGNYFSGAYPDRHLGQAMRKYAGHARRRDGLEFNNEVAQRMSDLGWQTETEVAITKIIGKALDRNYGDVDVLAWHFGTGRILVIECKDLQFRKTYGEIAEQLADFRGGTTEDGKRDLLRKHLDRVEVLVSHEVELRQYLGLTKDDCSIESHLVFRHPVPMQFAEGPVRTHVQLHIFSQLDSLRIGP